ncbi:MAG: hypothetical protein V4692_16060 [Bdellovibrionota bacterium]
MKTTKGLIVGLATTLATLLTSSLALANTEVTELEYYSLKGSELSYVYSVPAGCEKHQSKVRVDVRPLESETNGKTQIELFIRIEDRSKSVEACDDGETREVAGKKNIHSLVNKKLKKLNKG